MDVSKYAYDCNNPSCELDGCACVHVYPPPGPPQEAVARATFCYLERCDVAGCTHTHWRVDPSRPRQDAPR